MSVGFVSIDSVDPERLAPFWAELLGVEVSSVSGEGQFVVLGATDSGLVVSFQRVPEAKVGKNRAHLDLGVSDMDAATVEIEALGGRWLEPGTTHGSDGFQWRCMADPEGNEFDIGLVPS